MKSKCEAGEENLPSRINKSASPDVGHGSRADRAWFKRINYGKERYLDASGLERECNISAYVKKGGCI